MKQITIKDIQEFSIKYNQDKINKEIEEKITKLGLEKACINQKIIEENIPVFNIELSETKRYDQKDSFKCWIFAGINVIKRNMAENLNMEIMEFALSDNYISFFDRLEKSNDIYEKVIHSKSNDLEKIKQNYLKNCVEETGNWATFLAIITKYGICPYSVMPNSIEGENYEKIWYAYREKVKCDVITLLEKKKKGCTKKELEKIKHSFIEENYQILSKVLGEPVLKFDYQYQDKNNSKVILKDITPLQFSQEYITLNIKDYVAIENVKDFYSEYNKKYKFSTNVNIYKESDMDILNLKKEEQKDLVIKQLKDGIPVYVGVCIKKDKDIESGVLDTRLYDYSKNLGIKRLSKEEALKLNETFLHHWMVFTGVQVENGKPVRWKVEDSYGDKEKLNGYYIMNDNYFDEYVITIIVDKKYLNLKQLELWDQEPKIIK